VQADGDLMFVPGALWTMAHLGVAVLVVVHNNRQYGNTVEHAAAIATERGRDPSRRYVGAGLDRPTIDFAGLARSLGVWASGPIDSTERLGPALDAAIGVVAAGRPALIDVLTPGF
jgi:thiamine pyrophosphate-dependent acetolactate synthase large subunit-like protein